MPHVVLIAKKVVVAFHVLHQTEEIIFGSMLAVIFQNDDIIVFCCILI